MAVCSLPTATHHSLLRSCSCLFASIGTAAALRVISKALVAAWLLASIDAVLDMASLPFDSIDWFSVRWIIDKETSNACAFWGIPAVDYWPVAHPDP
jgi:hypothetical protein